MILYGCDYGFCENIVLWRGHFKATRFEKSINLSVSGGKGFAASVWLNDVYLGTNRSTVAEEFNETFIFPPGAIKPGKDNVITIVQDNMGLDKNGYSSADVLKSPRGIRGFQLDVDNFTEWRVQGKVGGHKGFSDKTPGVLNEGGLYGEREGWHLPGFSYSSWESRPLSVGFSSGTAGVGFFANEFELDIPEGMDTMMSSVFMEPLGQVYRAWLFVNGWMMGKRIGNLGPQSKFPVHEGILNYQGHNTVAVAIWSMINETISLNAELVLDALFEGGVGGVVSDNPGWNGLGHE